MIQNVLERILNSLDDDNALNIHNDINEKLLKYQDKGWINDDERDALRHYYTMMKLSDEYGGTIAWLAGIIHEDFGWQLLYPEDSEEYENIKVDLHNNNIALEAYENLPEDQNPLTNLFLAPNADYLKAPLAFLKTVERDPYFEGLPEGAMVPPKRKSQKQVSNFGYHPELDAQ